MKSSANQGEMCLSSLKLSCKTLGDFHRRLTFVDLPTAAAEYLNCCCLPACLVYRKKGKNLPAVLTGTSVRPSTAVTACVTSSRRRTGTSLLFPTSSLYYDYYYRVRNRIVGKWLHTFSLSLCRVCQRHKLSKRCYKKCQIDLRPIMIS